MGLLAFLPAFPEVQPSKWQRNLPHRMSMTKYVRIPRHLPGSPNSVALTIILSQRCFPSQSGNILSKTFFMPQVFFSFPLISHVLSIDLPNSAFTTSIT